MSPRTTARFVAWLWSFGDGAESEEQHPTHRYTELGVYEIVPQRNRRRRIDSHSSQDH
ncbi:MAG: PKD domain-containing protein [Limnochordia bacterium]